MKWNKILQIEVVIDGGQNEKKKIIAPRRGTLDYSCYEYPRWFICMLQHEIGQ